MPYEGKERRMHMPVLSVGLSAVFLTAALLAGPYLDHDEPPAEGSRVCLGSVGVVVCVPPEQLPPSPPAAPIPPSAPWMPIGG